MEFFPANYIGGSIAALISALSWAFCSILFLRLGDNISPLAVNFSKSVIGLIYLGIVLLLVGIKAVDMNSLILLGLSGVLGISLGDTFFFKSLNFLGPRLILLIETSIPVITIILARIFLHEHISFNMWMGIILISGGIVWGMWGLSPNVKKSGNIAKGVLYAVLFSFCTSSAIILSKVGVANAPTIQASFIRLLGGTIGLVLWGAFSFKLKSWVTNFSELKLLKALLFAVFIAIFGGFWLSILALKYLSASVATILNSTTPIFIIPLSILILKEKVSIRAIWGACVAVLGIALIFLR